MNKPLITHKDIIGWMAHWAIRQHPYARPDGLFEITDAITEAAQRWDIGPPGLKMCRMDWREIEGWLREALSDHPVLAQWNSPRSGHTAQWIATSRYGGPAAEDDFIDIDALLRNVARSVWRSELSEAEADEARVTPFDLESGFPGTAA